MRHQSQAMRLLQAAHVERASDGADCEKSNSGGCRLSFKAIEGRLIADIFQVDEDIRAWIDVRISRGQAHATAKVRARW